MQAPALTATELRTKCSCGAVAGPHASPRASCAVYFHLAGCGRLTFRRHRREAEAAGQVSAHHRHAPRPVLQGGRVGEVCVPQAETEEGETALWVLWDAVQVRARVSLARPSTDMRPQQLRLAAHFDELHVRLPGEGVEQ